MRAFKERVKEHPGAVKIILFFLIGILLGVLILFVKNEYFKATEEETHAYDKQKFLKDYAEPEEVKVVEALDPEIEGAFNIQNRYLLFEHFSTERVQWLQEEIEKLCGFYESLEDEDIDTHAFYETNETDIYKYIGEISQGEFEAVFMKLSKGQMQFVLKDSFTHYKSVGLVTFSIESEDQALVIECTVRPGDKSFVTKLLKY